MALIDDVEGLQSIYINRATGNGNDDDERAYHLYRQSVLDDPRVAALVPAWVPRYRNLDQFGGSSSRNSQATPSVGNSSGMILGRSLTSLNRLGSPLQISLSLKRWTALTLSTFGSLGQRRLKGAQPIPRELSPWPVRSWSRYANTFLMKPERATMRQLLT